MKNLFTKIKENISKLPVLFLAFGSKILYSCIALLLPFFVSMCACAAADRGFSFDGYWASVVQGSALMLAAAALLILEIANNILMARGRSLKSAFVYFAIGLPFVVVLIDTIWSSMAAFAEQIAAQSSGSFFSRTDDFCINLFLCILSLFAIALAELLRDDAIQRKGDYIG